MNGGSSGWVSLSDVALQYPEHCSDIDEVDFSLFYSLFS